MNPVVHFEMPYRDQERVMRFYQEAFGWKLQPFGPEMGNYILAVTAEEDTLPDQPRGAIGGGFFPAEDAIQQGVEPATNIVISVDDIDAHVGRVTAAGGTIVGEVTDVPGIGRYVIFTDTEGTRAAMLQPSGPGPQ